MYALQCRTEPCCRYMGAVARAAGWPLLAQPAIRLARSGTQITELDEVLLRQRSMIILSVINGARYGAAPPVHSSNSAAQGLPCLVEPGFAFPWE